jgi:alkyl hydroperoxide reductase subunit D
MTNGIATLIRKLPNYASDIKINLEKIFITNNEHLSQEALYSIALSIGYALQHEYILNHIRTDAKTVLENVDATACKIATVVMRMNNMFYNFRDMVEDDEIKSIDSGLSMVTLNDVGTDIMIFEMCCLAVSIINKCKYCIMVHKNKLLKREVTKDAIVEIAKIASVLAASADAMQIEYLRSYDFILRDANMDE